MVKRDHSSAAERSSAMRPIPASGSPLDHNPLPASNLPLASSDAGGSLPASVPLPHRLFPRFPASAHNKWRPRVTLSSLLPILQHLRSSAPSHPAPSQQCLASPLPSLPSLPLSAFLSRSQSVAHRVQASAELIRDLVQRQVSGRKAAMRESRMIFPTFSEANVRKIKSVLIR